MKVEGAQSFVCSAVDIVVVTVCDEMMLAALAVDAAVVISLLTAGDAVATKCRSVIALVTAAQR